MGISATAETAPYAFLDFDLNEYRRKYALAAAFVDATDARYGFSSKDLRCLGGSELARIIDLLATDHEWSSKMTMMSSGGGGNNSVEIRPPAAGNRLVVKLFWDIAPLACENFCTLCANGSLYPIHGNLQSSTAAGIAGNTKSPKVKPAPIGESGKPLTYRNSIVHRIIPGFIMQGGDFVFGNGSGGESIFNGKKFKDERAGLSQKHDRRGILSMGNGGKNSNTSQWFLTFDSAPQCDGKHVVFGEIVSGWEVMDAVEAWKSSVPTNNNNNNGSVAITDCGIWYPFIVPAAGYWYDQPDEESFTGISSVFMVRPRVVVLAPNSSVLQKFENALKSNAVLSLVNAESYETDQGIGDHLTSLLESFQIDVIVIAPACKNVMGCITVPESWAMPGGQELTLGEIALESKPVQALKRIHSDSWISKRTPWQLDGGSSF